MLNIKRLILLLTLAAMVGCGSGGDDDSFGTTVVPEVVDPDVIVIPDAASIDALTSNPQLQSDGGIPVTITALVKDANNNFIEGASVAFAILGDTNDGGLEPINLITGTNGVASASLTTAGNPENRVITVTTTSGELSDTVDVTVIGTSLQVSGPTSLAQGATATYTLVLNNANGIGIEGASVSVASSLGNTFSAQSLTTDSAGQAQVEYTAVNGGEDTVTVSALGESEITTVTISDDSFAFVFPSADSEINLGATQNITLRWSQNNAPVSGSTVNFATTRGTVTPASVVTNSNGEATATITAENSGVATITATTTNGPSASLDVEFVATLPNSIEVQADPFTVDPNSQSSITAIVRDLAGNLVKNIVVNFDVDDITGGGLSAPSSVTDSQGRARTVYTSSSTTSSVDGVKVTATVASDTNISDDAFLTVGGRAVFFTFGTGNQFFEPNPAQYRVPYIVQVTDADGRPVVDTNVVMSVTSVKFVKGYWCPSQNNDAWGTVVQDRCDDEDVNRNGILDPAELTDDNGNGFLDPAEDTNMNERIEAGNIATVIPGQFVSDSDGFGLIDIFYPQEYGRWLEVELQARTSVQGTEFSEKSVFLLDTLAIDTEDLDVAPPGLLTVPENFTPDTLVCPEVTVNNGTIYSSPFGYNADCAVFDFPN